MDDDWKKLLILIFLFKKLSHEKKIVQKKNAIWKNEFYVHKPSNNFFWASSNLFDQFLDSFSFFF